MTALLLVHAAATLVMTGIIWFVQVVHYPLFARSGGAAFARYAADHSRLTTRVVGPPMLVEAGAASLLVVADPRPLTAVGAVLLGGVWASTMLLQVPCHRRLAEGFDAAVHRRLVRGNWIRTVAWTARGGVALALLAT